MIQFKSKTEENEFPNLRKRAQIIALEMAEYCHERGVPFIITDILSEASEDAKLKRISTSHQEGRAFDVRTYLWTKEFREKMTTYFEEKFKSWAAKSKSTLLPNLIEYHSNGNGYHFHVQIRPYKD